MKKKVAIVYGGYSSESKISQKSGGVIYEHINRDLFEPYLVEITENSWHVHINGGVSPIDKNKFTFISNDEAVSFDIAFITIHGTPGEDGKLQAYFDLVGLPYINSNCFAAALSFNKWACNSFLRAFGIATAKAILIRNGETPNVIEIADELGFPCFVKPNDGGSSFGVSKVKTLMDMPGAIAAAFEEGSEVVIESAIVGREITCGVFFNGSEVVALPPTEIISENEFFDYQAKDEGKSQEITPAEIPVEWTTIIQNTTKNIYRRLGLRGLARVDYIVTKEGVPNLIEVNTNPGMSAASIIPQQLRVAGLDLTKTLTALLQVQ
ncbi:MAG: D-alanine--D-alanine ligase [Crocinitomicaceae bacterium]|nr:D-alanine--D-alanine ligase [Crocinitomicaceae bacterium]